MECEVRNVMGVVVAYTMAALSSVWGAGPGDPRLDPARDPHLDPTRADTVDSRREEGAGQGTAIEREVFTYPVAGRRDPFLPPSPSVGDVPLFRAVRLLGIISHIDPHRNVAVIRVHEEHAEGVAGSEMGGGQDAGESHRVRIGDRIGGIEVLAISARRVVVVVEGPAGPMRRLLELASDPGTASR